MLKPILKTKPQYPAVLYQLTGWDGEAGCNRFVSDGDRPDVWCDWTLINPDRGIYQSEFEAYEFRQDSKGSWYAIED